VAYASGTATDFLDLYNKLRDFLKTNSTLVAAGQAWTQISGPTGTLTDTSEIVMKGPGAGTDEILVGMRANISVGGDYYNINFSGFTTWNPATSYAGQVNSTHDYMLNCWNQPMPYWFVANGRRFIVVVRVASVYMSAYCGFILPYVLPNLWPYPLFIGACSRTPTWRYSVATPNMSAFFDPGETNASLMFPDVIWRGVVNRFDSGGGGIYGPARENVNTHPFRFDNAPIRENLDGSYNLEQVSIICQNPYLAQLGALQGVFRVSGFANAAENIVTNGGINHLVIPNVMRVSWDDFAAIALE
jgi:hypothetical protein